MNTEVELQRVMEQVLDATILPEIAAAKQVLRDWLKLHPEEEGMRAGFEQLYLLEEIAQEQEAEQGAATSHAQTQPVRSYIVMGKRRKASCILILVLDVFTIPDAKSRDSFSNRAMNDTIKCKELPL